MATALKTVEEQILQQYSIKEHDDPIREISQFRIVDKKTGEEKAQIQLTLNEETTVAKYTSKNHWFKHSNTKAVQAINVRWLTSQQKGLGSLMLAYGVLQMKHKNPKIKYSVLDDDSDQSTHITKNIYSRFGYSPVEAVTRTGENTVKLQGPEKQVLLTDFVKHVETMFPSRKRSRNSTKSNISSRTEKNTQRLSRRTRRKTNSA